MERLIGLIGIGLIFGTAYWMSSNRKAINYRLVFSGMLLQVLLAVFILKVPLGQKLFAVLGAIVTKLLDYSKEGGRFVFGIFGNDAALNKVFGDGAGVVFTIMLLPTIIFVCVLTSVLYHLGIMQRVVAFFARLMHAAMRVSGSESLSNVSSTFVGQVEAQIMIQPYLRGMTQSELLASMTGSMACIAGGVMAVYIGMGVKAEYLLAASVMAAPAALVIAKIVMPETQASETKGLVKIEIKQTHVNLLDAIAHGAGSGMRVSLNVVAMLIGFIALIALMDGVLGLVGRSLAAHQHLSLAFIGVDLQTLSLKQIFGALFSTIAFVLGVPGSDSLQVGSLMGTKFVVNEFVAYSHMTAIKASLSPKALVIASFALCGFANLSSIAIQIGGIGELAPERRHDLARLGFKAMICGTLTNYLSAAIAGILM
ncbi:MAG: nucleoside transporter C-terminal domain-containing protein [Verrucomicrobiota bacterium]